MAVSKFILLNTHSSGTRLLLGALGSNLPLKCYKRAFELTTILDRFAFDRLGSQFYKFRFASAKRQIDYFFDKKQVVNDFLQQIYTPPNSEVRAVGIRLLYEQADKHPEILEWALKNKVAIIHLIRQNTLKTVVYTEASFKRGLLHSTSRVEPVATLRLSPARLKAQLDRLTQQIETYHIQLKSTRYLEVFYESLAANCETETRRVFEFLEINPIPPVMVDSMPLNFASLESTIENYQEIKQALSGTTFEKFLNESAEQ